MYALAVSVVIRYFNSADPFLYLDSEFPFFIPLVLALLEFNKHFSSFLLVWNVTSISFVMQQKKKLKVCIVPNLFLKAS